jgi:Transposase DDE domain
MQVERTLGCEIKNAATHMVNILFEEISLSLKNIRIVGNLSRQKMLILTVCSLVQSRSVLLNELAYHLNDRVKTASNETRLQDFFREVPFDYDALASFLLCFLNDAGGVAGGKIRLTIDRTEWDFGQQQTNILMVIASKGRYTVPLYWEMLDNNSGNSHTNNRIDILKRCIELIGAKNISYLVADREFIGHVWLKWLKDNKIAFCVRVPKSHLIEKEDGETLNAEHIWTKQKSPTAFKICLVDGVWLSAKILTDAKGEMLFLIGTVEAKFLEQFYQKRWTIETVFQAFKTRGFNLEDTHLKANEKLKKLVAIVSLTFALCVSIGIFKHEQDQNIKTKNHKRKPNSFFRYGLDFLREGFKSNYKYAQQWAELINKFFKKMFITNSLSST